jgi:hypothetical protein
MNGFDRQLEREIAAGERWLSGFATPHPSADAVDRAQRAARAALARSDRVRAGKRWATWQGVLGVAAMLALAVTVGWYSSVEYDAVSNAVAVADLQWPDQTKEEATQFALLDDGLAELEAWSLDESALPSGTDLYEAMEYTWEEEPNGSSGESGALLHPREERLDSREVTWTHAA